MVELLRSFVIGAIQGVSEFLPVSSSGHLVLIPYIFNWDYRGLAFDVALHFGTVLALLAYFWKDWLGIIANGLAKQRDSETAKEQFNNYPKNLLWQILLASVPAAIVGLTINDYVEQYFHSPILLTFNLIFFGWLLWYIDIKSKNNLPSSTIRYPQTFLVGLFQSISLIPGVSRSGITMTAGRLAGLNREGAARLSFLLGTPAMIGAFLVEFKDISKTALDATFWLGVLAATIFGFLAIKYLLRYLAKSDFSIFMWYRIALAATVILFYLAR